MDRTLPEQRLKVALVFLAGAHGRTNDQIGRYLARKWLVKRCRRNNYCLAGAAVARKMERLGFVVAANSSRDMWAIRVWYLTTEGRRRAERIIATEKRDSAPPATADPVNL